MNCQIDKVWSLLLQKGLVQGSSPAIEQIESPWYVKALLAFSGWLAALFLLGFIGVGLAFIMRDHIASFVIGMMMIGSAFAMLRMPKSAFFEHLALAISLAGQALIAFAIFDIFKQDDEVAWLLIAILQAPLVAIMPNFLHRVFSSLFAALAFSMALSSVGAPYVFSGVVIFVASWLWLNEFQYPKDMERIKAIGYGLVLALIQLKGTALFGFSGISQRAVNKQSELFIQPWMGELLASLALLYVVWQLLQRYGHTVSESFSMTVLFGTLVICAASMEATGISAGLVIILLGFSCGNRVLMGLGIASLLFYISSYYYLLDVTLLHKAGTLLCVGLALLSMRWFMLHITARKTEVNDV